MSVFPRKTRGIFWYSNENVKYEEKDIPSLKPKYALVKINYSAVCATDRKIYHHGFLIDRKLHYPAILGHEASGTILKLGERMDSDKEGNPLNEGDSVVIEDIEPCGKCVFCRSRSTNVCQDVRYPGITSPGTFIEYWVYPQMVLHKAEDLTPKQGALVEPAAVGMHGTRIGGVKIGDAVLIYGAGPIGLFALQAAKWQGADKIMVSDPVKFKRRVAKDLGADVTINPREEDVVERVKEETDGLGADVVLEDVGLAELEIESFKAARPRGNIVFTGFSEDNLNWNFNDFILRELRLFGSNGYAGWTDRKHDFSVAINLIRTGKVKTEPIITHEFKLEDFRKAFEQADKVENTIKVGFQIGY